jgi:aconitate hydratase 2/2-methylisocitrate dehydratase
MSIYSDYLREIEERKGQGLHPKPIDGAELLSEIITQIKDIENADRAESLHFSFTIPCVLHLQLVLKQFFKKLFKE